MHSFGDPLLQSAFTADVIVSARARVSSEGGSSSESASKVTHIVAETTQVLRAVASPCYMLIPMWTLPENKHMKEEWFHRAEISLFNLLWK